MTRKDYEKIARALKDAAIREVRWTEGELGEAKEAMLKQVVESLAYMLKQDNSNFRADRFREAVYAFREDVQWPKGVPGAEAEIEETFKEVA